MIKKPIKVVAKTVEATKEYVDFKVANAAVGDVDLTKYITKTELDARGYLTSIPDNYATTTYVDDFNGGKRQVFITQNNYKALSDTEKDADDIVYNITDINAISVPISDSASVPNNSIFIDSGDGLLKFKDNSGTIRTFSLS